MFKFMNGSTPNDVEKGPVNSALLRDDDNTRYSERPPSPGLRTESPSLRTESPDKPLSKKDRMRQKYKNKLRKGNSKKAVLKVGTFTCL